jgi:hypothetical protein
MHIRCCGSLVTEPLPSNGYPLWFHCSGFHMSWECYLFRLLVFSSLQASFHLLFPEGVYLRVCDLHHKWYHDVLMLPAPVSSVFFILYGLGPMILSSNCFLLRDAHLSCFSYKILVSPSALGHHWILYTLLVIWWPPCGVLSLQFKFGWFSL